MAFADTILSTGFDAPPFLVLGQTLNGVEGNTSYDPNQGIWWASSSGVAPPMATTHNTWGNPGGGAIFQGLGGIGTQIVVNADLGQELSSQLVTVSMDIRFDYRAPVIAGMALPLHTEIDEPAYDAGKALFGIAWYHGDSRYYAFDNGTYQGIASDPIVTNSGSWGSVTFAINFSSGFYNVEIDDGVSVKTITGARLNTNPTYDSFRYLYWQSFGSSNSRIDNILVTDSTLPVSDNYKTEVEDWVMANIGIKDDVIYSGGAMAKMISAKGIFQLPAGQNYHTWILRQNNTQALYADINDQLIDVPYSGSWNWAYLGEFSDTVTIELIGRYPQTTCNVDVILFHKGSFLDPPGNYLATADVIVPTLESLDVTLPYGPEDKKIVTIDSYNNLRIDGEFFFPTYMWHPAYPSSALLGVTVHDRVSITGSDYLYQSYERLGLPFGIRAPNADAPNRDLITQARVPGLSNHPDLLFWHFGDEPVNYSAWVDYVTAFKALDPDHPTYIRPLGYQPSQYEPYANIVDIVGLGNSNCELPAWVTAYGMDAPRSVLNDSKPIWALYWIATDGTFAQGWYCLPEQARVAMYTQLIHGAKGLSLFAEDHLWQYASHWGGGKPLPSWEEVSAVWWESGRVLREIRQLWPALEAPAAEQNFTIVQGAYNIDALLKVTNGEAFLLTANLTTSNVSAEIDISQIVGSLPDYEIQVLFEGKGDYRTITPLGNDHFTDQYAPLATHVYKITSSEPITVPEETFAARMARINAWLSRCDPDPRLISLQITSPTSSATYSTSSPTITLGGTVTKYDKMANLTWSNDRTNPGWGGIDWETNWTSDPISLESGVNVLVVTLEDCSGNKKTDTITVTYTP